VEGRLSGGSRSALLQSIRPACCNVQWLGLVAAANNGASPGCWSIVDKLVYPAAEEKCWKIRVV
jgi:hypothetical protein